MKITNSAVFVSQCATQILVNGYSEDLEKSVKCASKIGGDFMKSLCETIGMADIQNTARLLKAFGDEWFEYYQMADNFKN